jgi:hypothetical protein
MKRVARNPGPPAQLETPHPDFASAYALCASADLNNPT